MTRRLRFGRLAAAAAGFVALLAAGPGRAQLYEVEGLRLGMTVVEAQLVLPDLRVTDVPYVDERIGTNYRIIYGRIAVLRQEGSLLVTRPGHAAQLQYLFTGDGRLFAVQARVRDEAVGCDGMMERIRQAHGPPIVLDGRDYALWRQVVVLGPQLELQCLSRVDGFFTLTLRQDDMQRRYLETLFRDLEPAVQAAIQFLG